MICDKDQVEVIIKKNPQKAIIEYGKSQCQLLRRLIDGHDSKEGLVHDAYFENSEVFGIRKKSSMSNKDLFGRLFQREWMVFSAQGGSSYYQGLDKKDSISFSAKLDSVIFSVSLRKWIKQFAFPAFKTDPMGVIFMEADDKGNSYPTYKSIYCVYDYLSNGRQLEYICFRLTAAQVVSFGIKDEKLKDQKPDFVTDYYRFIDDQKDDIYKFENDVVSDVNLMPNPFSKTAAFIISDIISFEDTSKFLSPAHLVTELAASYMNDRSIRDVQKKYHGFLKAIEPLLQCGRCAGTGLLSGAACPECTPAGSDKGTGFKLTTKPADIARFPLSILKDGNFDYNKIFGYAKLPIEVWDKQDNALADIENLIRDVYWGTDNRQTVSGPTKTSQNTEETATKTDANLQPIYARLNMTADWAEKTENLIADFIGGYMFPSKFKKSSINYGRYWILETPNELMDEYLTMKSKGASQSSLFSSLKKYVHSVFESDPPRLAVELKMINVEPFVHSTISEVKAFNTEKNDYFAKLYFSEWRQQQDFDYLLATGEKELRDSLLAYAVVKATAAPEEKPNITAT